MIDWIREIDFNLLLAINGAHSSFLDTLMWGISGKFIWFPMYIFLFVLVYLKYPLKHAVWFTLFGIAAVGLCDFTSTHLFKEAIMRPRPSHTFLLQDQLHYYQIKPGDLYRGGAYGFISGHASNSTVIALMFIQQLRSYYKYITPILIFWVLIVCYSRMYLGVHFPTDIVGGIIWGALIALLFYWVYRKVILKPENHIQPH